MFFVTISDVWRHAFQITEVSFMLTKKKPLNINTGGVGKKLY